MRVSIIYSSFTQAKALVVVESVQGFCTNFSKSDITVGKSGPSKDETGVW